MKAYLYTNLPRNYRSCDAALGVSTSFVVFVIGRKVLILK